FLPTLISVDLFCVFIPKVVEGGIYLNAAFLMFRFYNIAVIVNHQESFVNQQVNLMDYVLCNYDTSVHAFSSLDLLPIMASNFWLNAAISFVFASTSFIFSFLENGVMLLSSLKYSSTPVL